MKHNVMTLAMAAALLGGARDAAAQRTTERYIPVGQSPGISGIRSYIGGITAVDSQRKTFTVTDSAATHTIKVTEQTRIWLDRSAQRLPNEVGGIADLQAGRRAEVKFVDDRTRDTADWIKVAIPAGG